MSIAVDHEVTLEHGLLDGEVEGVWTAIERIAASPSALPLFVMSGALAPHALMRFMDQSGSGGELLEGLAPSTRYGVMGGRDWLLAFVNYFMGYKQQDVRFAQDWIPVAEIHRPHVYGCAVELSLSTSTAETRSFKLSAAGFAGGGGYSKTIRQVSEIKTANLSQRLEARANLKIVTYVDSAGRVIRAISIAKIFDELRYHPIFDDDAPIDIDQLINNIPGVSVRSAPSDVEEFTEKIAIDIGRVHEFSWKSAIQDGMVADSAFALTAKSQILTRAELRYQLKPGNRYAFCPAPPGSHVILVFHDEKL